MSAPTSLPSGRVTFAFIDVVGSTRTFIEHGAAYAKAVTALHATVAEHATRAGGAVVETEGDGAFLAFPDASSATEALVALQSGLERANGEGLHLRVRAGAHTGEAEPVAGHYLALAVYVAARVSATANAGQVLVTDELLADLRAAGSGHHRSAILTGTYHLKDLPDPVRIWRVAGDDLPPRATPARPTNVQPSRTSFLGRETELERIRELVGEPGLVTLVGPGGVGKTRLASEFALRDAQSLPGGVWLVELATFETPDHVVPATAAALGFSSGGMSDLRLELKRRGRCVLLLDNCEHLVEPVVEMVDELLATCPELSVLCTSREALGVAGERVRRVPPLPAAGAATELFLDRAGRALTDTDDRELIGRLCNSLDGLPLAIELASSQAATAPLQEILDAVAHGSDSLERSGGQPRQRSLDTVLDWSLDRLRSADRDSLLTLAVFPGRFSPDMARALLGAAPRCEPEAIRELTRGSLVDIDGPDYRLLSTVRAAAQRRLDADAELHDQALDALVPWAADYGRGRAGLRTTHDDVTEDTILALESACARGLDTGNHVLGKAWDLLHFITVVRGADPRTLELCERARQVPPSDTDTAYMLTSAVLILEAHGIPASLSDDTFAALKVIAREADNPRLLVRTLNAQAFVAETQGQLDTARRLWQEQLQLCETREECRPDLPYVLLNAASFHFNTGDLATHEALTMRSVEASTSPGEEVIHAWALAGLSESALVSSRHQEARDHALAALKAAPAAVRLRAVTLSFLARALVELGDRAEALAAAREALASYPSDRELDDALRVELDALLEAFPELMGEIVP